MKEDYAGCLEKELEEIDIMDEKNQEGEKLSLSSICSPWFTIICC